MATHSVQFEQKIGSTNVNLLAILFFIMGAPHVYTGLRRHMNLGSFLASRFLSLNGFGWLVATFAAIAMLVGFDSGMELGK
ncbi:hypothetical protein C8B47_30525 [filamentous cyanobacterium CCP4]|nr:hypothetical protein C8B47_30525 [filamentous cyanobacterium CCP4]